MRPFTSELHYIDELYQCLRNELSRLESDAAADDAVLVGSVIRNEELLCRIGHLTERVSQFSEEWIVFRNRVDPSVRKEVEALARRVRANAEDLLRLCAGSGRKLQAALERLGRDVRQLQKGFRYLDTVKPVRTNYPKFIDSVG